jgi:trigger factor
MQVSVENISPVLVEFSVVVEAEVVTREYEKSFKKVSKGSKIKGFRPGKAPRNIIQRVFGPRVEAEVVQRLVDDTFAKAAAEKSMQPISRPSVEPERLNSGQAFSYKARVEILPKIESVTYEGLAAKRPKPGVTDEQIEKELEAIRRANSTLEAPKKARKSKEGDVVTCDLAVTVDGEVIDDAAATGLAVEIGAGQILKEIEKAATGLKVDASATAEVEMPETHPHPKLKGKKALFTITAKEIKERILPAADDELAKDLGDFETLAELKADIRKQLEATEKEQSENVLAERLVQALVEANPVPLPPSLVAQQMQVSEREIVTRARMQGQRVTGVGNELRDKIKNDSELKVRAGLVMAEIAKKESIKIGPEEIEEGLKELAGQTGKNVAKLRAEYSEPRKREMLIGMILENKVLDLIEAKATITDEE